MIIVREKDQWSDEGSGGSGDYDSDIIWLTGAHTTTSTTSSTTTSGSPATDDVTAVVSSIMQRVTSTLASQVKTTTPGLPAAPAPGDDTTVASSTITYFTSTLMPQVTTTEKSITMSISVERLSIFFGVLFVLVILAVGICIYVKYFHGRNSANITTPRPA